MEKRKKNWHINYEFENFYQKYNLTQRTLNTLFPLYKHISNNMAVAAPPEGIYHDSLIFIF